MNKRRQPTPEVIHYRRLSDDLKPRALDEAISLRDKATRQSHRRQRVENIRDRIFNNNSEDRAMKVLLGTLAVVSLAVAIGSVHEDNPDNLPESAIITYADLGLEPSDGPRRAAEELTQSVPLDARDGLEISATDDFRELGQYTADRNDYGFAEFYEISQVAND